MWRSTIVELLSCFVHRLDPYIYSISLVYHLIKQELFSCRYHSRVVVYSIVFHKIDKSRKNIATVAKRKKIMPTQLPESQINSLLALREYLFCYTFGNYKALYKKTSQVRSSFTHFVLGKESTK